MEAGAGRDAEPAGQLATAEVGIDEQHPAAVPGRGDGERGGKPDRVGSAPTAVSAIERGPPAARSVSRSASIPTSGAAAGGIATPSRPETSPVRAGMKLGDGGAEALGQACRHVAVAFNGRRIPGRGPGRPPRRRSRAGRRIASGHGAAAAAAQAQHGDDEQPEQQSRPRGRIAAQSGAERSRTASAGIVAAAPSASGLPSTATIARWKPSAAAAATSGASASAVTIRKPPRGEGRTLTSASRSAPGTSLPSSPAALVATSVALPR